MLQVNKYFDYLPIQYLGDTSMTNSQLTRYDTWSNTSGSHFNNFQSDVIGKWATIDEYPT